MSFSIEYIYRIVDKFSPVLGRMASVATKFDKGVTKVQVGLKKMAAGMQRAGAKMANLQTGLASLGTGLILKNAMDEAMTFNKALNMTSAVVSDFTNDDMVKMREEALRLGSATQFSSVQAAQAMAEFGKMGLNVEQILAVLPGSMDLAAAGEIEMAEAATYTMGILNQFGKGVEEAGFISDLMATAASNSATSVREMSASMANTGLQARMAGLSIKDTSLALMAMAQQSLKGEAAGTMMMNALKALQVMPKKVRKGFEGLGINIDQFRDKTTGQMKDFWGLIKSMKTAGATGADLGKMFDVRAMKAMSILVGTNDAQFAKLGGTLENVGGNAKKMAEKLLTGPVGSMVRFQSVMQNLNVMIGETLATTITPLIEGFTKFLGKLQRTNPNVIKFITYLLIGLTAIGAILIPLGLLVGAIGSLVGVISTVIGVVKVWSITQAILNTTMAAFPLITITLGIIALIAVVILLVKNWKTVSKWIGTGWDVAVAGAKKFWDWLLKLLDNPFFRTIGLIMAQFITIPLLIIKNWESVSSFFINLGTDIGSFVSIVWNLFSNLLDNPFFAAIGKIFLPFITIPALVVKNWDTVKKTFIDLYNALMILDFGTIWEMFVSGLGNVKSFLLDAIFWPIEQVLGLIAKIPVIGKAAVGGLDIISKFKATIGGVEKAPEVPKPESRMVEANARASVSVYTEKGLTAVPYRETGNLGFNLEDAYGY